ncbi:MAG: hypothetical protein ACO3BI_06185 [Candidatus Nanopelagicales bacterium]
MELTELCTFCRTNPYAPESGEMIDAYFGNNGERSEFLMSCKECNLTLDGSHTWKYASGAPAPTSADEVSDPIQKWYLQQKKVGTKSNLDFDVFTTPAGLFNVEGGWVTFSSLQARECCEINGAVSGNCEECGNGENKSHLMLAGGGDGVYAVWKDDEELASNIFVSFAPYKGDIHTLEGAIEYHEDSIPLYIGSIDSDGAIYVRESYQGQVAILVPPGSYDIVAWIGTRIRMKSFFELDSESAGLDSGSYYLQALSVSIHPAGSTDYKESTTKILDGLNLTTNKVQGALWGSPSMNVLSHMQPATEFINFFSYQFIGTRDLLRSERAGGELYFHLKSFGLEVLGDQAKSELQTLKLGTADELIPIALMFMHIGKESDALELMTRAADKGSDLAEIYVTRWQSQENCDLFPTWGVMSGDLSIARGDALNLKYPTEACDYYLMAAERGRPEGLFGSVRNSLLSGDTEQALKIYRCVRRIVVDQLQSATGGMELRISNYFKAMLFLADNLAAVGLLGNEETSDALKLWEETIQSCDPSTEYPIAEAMLFTLTLKRRLGEEADTGTLSTYSKETVESIAKNLAEYVSCAEASGAVRIVQWLEDCLQTLRGN